MILENRTDWQGSTAPSVVVAMGGHAFIQPGEEGTHDDHSRNARLICSWRWSSAAIGS